MVLRRGDTRHKDVPDPLEAGPKRVPTIHAQRKFAQGSGVISPGMSPIKEKEKSGKLNGGATPDHQHQSPSTSSTSSSAIPAKRPRTEDFITFLCYRGTSVLPAELNSFNIASKPEKNDRENAAASSSLKHSSPTRQEKEEKMKRMKCTKRAVMQSKSKVLDQRQRKTRINAIVQKAGKVLKSQNVNSKLSKKETKRVAAITVTPKSKQIKARPAGPVRASHASILKRLGASRLRAGLRSSGQLPPGSDVGLKVERKPLSQKYLKNKVLSSTKRKVNTPVRMKAKVDGKIPLGTPVSRKNSRGRELKSPTPSKSTPPRSLNLAKRPSRKTKEAAALYMELITKDLRSPEEEEDSAPPKPDDQATNTTRVKTRTRSGTIESAEVTSVPKSKPLKKKSGVQTQSPSPKKNLKPNSTPSTSKHSMKRTRRSLRDEMVNEASLEEDGKHLRKSMSSEKSDRTLFKGKQSTSGSRVVKKPETLRSNVPRKNDEELSEASSQSEEDESSSCQPSPKRAKKVIESTNKGIKNNADKLSNPISNKDGKSSKDIDQDASRRSTRSSRGIEPEIKAETKTVSDKKSQGLKSKNTSSSVPSDSESCNSEAEKKLSKKEIKARQNIKKEPKSDTENEEEAQSKPPERKPAKASKTSAKMIDSDMKVNDPAPKLPLNKKELNEDVVTKRAPGRPKKITSLTFGRSSLKEGPSAKKSTEVEEKTKKHDSTKLKNLELKQASESSSESEVEMKVTRQTRHSKTGNSDAEKHLTQIKRTSRTACTSQTKSRSEESDSDEVSEKVKKGPKLGSSLKEEAPKSKIPSKRVAIKSDESDYEDHSEKNNKAKSQKEETLRPKRPSRQAVVKSEAQKRMDHSDKSEDSESEETPAKPGKALRKSSIKAAKPDYSDDSDKESGAKPRKSIRQLSLVKAESADEGVKKVKVTRQSLTLESGNESEREATKQPNSKSPKVVTKESDSKPIRKKSIKNDDNSATESEGLSKASTTKSKLQDEFHVSTKSIPSSDEPCTDSTSKTSPKIKLDAPKSDIADKECSVVPKTAIKIEDELPTEPAAPSKPTPAKRGRPSKASLKTDQSHDVDQSEIAKSTKPLSVGTFSLKDDKVKIKGSNKDKDADNKINDSKIIESKQKTTKEKPEPKKRGRKPKKVEVKQEVVEEETQIRASRRRAATKKETYSEFTEGEEEGDATEAETEQSPVTLTRTRGRKSNVKYTEKDTDDEDDDDNESEIEKRPLRARRSVFRASLNLDLDSDDDFLSQQPPARLKKQADSEFVSKKLEVVKVEKPDDDSPNEEKDKLMNNGSVERPAAAADVSSDSNKFQVSRTTRRSSIGSKQDSSVTELKSTSSKKGSHLDSTMKSSDRSMKTSTNLNDIDTIPSKTPSLGKVKGQSRSVSDPVAEAPQPEIPSEPKPEPKRITRRLSKDRPEVAGEVSQNVELKSQEQVITVCTVKSEGLSSLREVSDVASSFMMDEVNKSEVYDDNNGLATLADVAFSELQNRKNIMGRKLSSDSATSFSSDDVLLPVRKEKVLPKAKADLPTVREKTESDEELSDVGNEETEDESSYDDYRKAGKPTRRKRMPKRLRKEPVRLPSQRPVRSRRAKLNNDSYVNEESFSSDRSSSPEPAKVKPIQKKRRQSEEKPAVEPKVNSAVKRSAEVPPALTIPSTSHTIVSTVLPVNTVVTAVPEKSKDPTPLGKIIKETKPVISTKASPKPNDPQWNLLLKVVEAKPAPSVTVPPVPKPPISQPLPKPRQPFVEATPNNSVTLFSGVSGVCIMKADGKLIGGGGLPMSKDELSMPLSQGLVSSRVPVDSQAKPSAVHNRPVTVPSSQPLPTKGNLFNMKGVTDSSNPILSRPTIGDTWKNAFINAKFPKPGQLSPAHHSNVGTPFVRKPFSPAPKTPTKPEEVKPAFVPTKLPGVQTFKNIPFQNFGKLGSQSPSRMPGGMSPNRTPTNNPPGEPKPHVYLSPSRVKNSPSKFDEKFDSKKPDSLSTKSLTLLQYEKRSQELISSLKESHPVLVDGNQFVPAYPTKLKEYSMEKTKSQQAKPALPPPPPPLASDESSKSEGGKHLNLPFPVEQAFRKRSPITVKKPVKPVEKKSGLAISTSETPTLGTTESCSPQNSNAAASRPPTEIPSSSTDFTRVKANPDVLSKKKFQLTKEEINKWLIDSTNSGVEHTKGCGIFENVQCKCLYQIRVEAGGSVNAPAAEVVLKQDELSRVDHGVVEPPVQLKELDSNNKFTAETISTCKVEDYKEKMFSKTPKSQPHTQPPPAEEKKELFPPTLPKPKKIASSPADKSKRKRSMTEEEMCEFDFRFERTPNSPRESGSDMSSPTPRDDVSSSNEDKFDAGLHSTERKAIFLQKRQLPPPPPPSKRPPVSKSPCAFSAENESSVYAFEPDVLPPPTLNHPFRRRGSRHKSSEDETPPSSSIAVQVNLENVASNEAEQVLECSTQTEQVDNEGQLFYFPIESDNNPQEVIQGVQVKLQSTEGPEQKVIMKAKLVTKPSANVPMPPNVRPLGEGGRPQKPEQKVRPLSSTSTSTQIKPLVGTVQPTVRELQPSSSTTFTSQGTTTTSSRPELTNQSTQAAAVPHLVTPPTSLAAAAPSPSLPEQIQPEAKIELAKQEVSPAPAPVPTPPAKSAPTAPAPRRSSPNEFPIPGTTPRMVDAPTFYPSEKEFQDPLEYIEQITNQAQSFGICRIVPPASFKPECKVSDDMRFTAYNQYVHKMLYRWGPNVREMTAIKKYLATQSIALKQPPWIGGMEIDLPRLYQTVQTCGGLKEVIEKKRWAKVADLMKIPKAAHDRVTKLDDIYCKFLLPYDTLSHSERSKLLEEVDAEWTERERRIALEAERESKGEKEEKEENSESEEESDDGRDECITKGRTMPLSGFYRIARNTMAMWFKEPTKSAKEVENEYWRQVTSRKQHVCVNSGSIDSGSFGYGFPTAKSSSTSRHPWNLKVLTNNSGSILRSMGPLMGVTVPTLHVGMLFAACCWYRDPHGLPWIEYLHTGANKIWYGVPDLWNEELHGAMRTILPRYCQNKPIWLASDTAMVPPDLLVQQGVSLCRSVQEPGQFILVFPKAFTSTICTGYCVSESVYFAQPSWLMTASQIFKDIKESCEPAAFSLEKLLFNIATDARCTAEVLTEILPMITQVRDTELRHRKELEELGVTDTERLAMSKGRKKSQEEPQEYECEICRGNLYLSLVTNVVEEANFCLQHAVETLTKDPSHVKNCKLMYSYDEEEMDEVLDKIKQRIETKSGKKQNVKATGGSSKA